jgi:hypothetical protein
MEELLACTTTGRPERCRKALYGTGFAKHEERNGNSEEIAPTKAISSVQAKASFVVPEAIGKPLRLRGAGGENLQGKTQDGDLDLDKGGDTNMDSQNTEQQRRDESHDMDIQNDDADQNQQDGTDQKACADTDENDEDHSASEITGEVAADSERKSVFVHGIPADCRPRDIFNLFRYFPGFEYTTVSCACSHSTHPLVGRMSYRRHAQT